MTVPVPAIDGSLATEQVWLHRGIVATSTVASGLLALMLVALTWGSIGAGHIIVWLGCLAIAFALRAAVALAERRAKDEPGRATRWLWRYRVAFALHGSVWGVGGLLALDATHKNDYNLVAFAMFAIAAGSLLATAFDLAAALFFSAPVIGALLLHLALHSHSDTLGIAMIVLVFVALASLNALRTQRAMRDTGRLRQLGTEQSLALLRGTEQAHAAQLALAKQDKLLGVLMQTTRQGYWFIDGQGLTNDVNPAMCRLLGRPREQVVGRSVFDFFEGEDLAEI